MTDRELAQNLRDAERRLDYYDIAEYENEICVRLDLPLDETEQGLTIKAAEAIQQFLVKNRAL